MTDLNSYKALTIQIETISEVCQNFGSGQMTGVKLLLEAKGLLIRKCETLDSFLSHTPYILDSIFCLLLLIL